MITTSNSPAKGSGMPGAPGACPELVEGFRAFRNLGFRALSILGLHPARHEADKFFHHIFPVPAITDLPPNQCEDASTVHHQELRPSPETNAFPDANFSPLFDNLRRLPGVGPLPKP